MTRPSIIRLVGCGLTGLAIIAGAVNGTINPTPLPPGPDGTMVEQPDYRPMLFADADDWEARV